MSAISIDPSKTLHEVPSIRGAMTEWMFSGEEDPGKSVDPRGVEYSYGGLLNLRKEDIELAARTGLTTIRCAVSHTSLEDKDTPGKWIEAGFERIGELFDWYGQCGINGILDLHNALGREGGGDPRLWQQKEFQDRFVNVWKELARRFKDHPQVIAFEPLNEPEPRHTDDFAERYRVWNDLAKRTTDGIREIDAKTPIIINCIEYANPSAFAGLEPTGDENTIYSFHWYAPSEFHCQKRPWMKDKGTYHYPDEYHGKWWDRNTIHEAWKPALDFATVHNARLFCGEFGCVSDVPEMEDMCWLLDIVSLFDQLGIDWTYYLYMFRTVEPYWTKEGHFDCNMFVRDATSGELRTFDRKVSLLSDLMKLRGTALDHDQPDDGYLVVYAVRLPDGNLRIYASNKSRTDAKSLALALAGGPWAPQVEAQRMAVGTGGYVEAPSMTLKEGRLDLRLEPLTILHLTVQAQGN